MFTVVNKKTVVTALAVLALVVSPFAGAPAMALEGASPKAFNTDPNDRPTLRVTNYTRNAECNTCWSYETAASVGDTVSFDLYYHNTSDVSAPGTTASVGVTPSGSYIRANGSVDAPGFTAGTGNANVNVDMTGYKNLRATFVGAFWYPDRTTSGQGISAGGGSASIGTIGAGWDHQGHVVFRYKIEAESTSGPVTPPPSGNQSVNGYQDGQWGNKPPTNCLVNGWASDPDGAGPHSGVSGKVKVNVYAQFANNPGSNYTFVRTGVANLPRTDLGQAGVCQGGGSSCAFVENLSDVLQPGVAYRMKVMAIDPQTGAERELPPSSPTDRVITCGSGTVPPPDNTCPAPVVTTGGVITVDRDHAIVSGFIDGKGKSAEYWVEYGSNPDQLGGQSIKRNGSGQVEVTIAPLQLGRTYYYRFVVKTSCGTQYGAVRFFQSPPRDTPPPQCTAPTATTLSHTFINNNTAVRLTGSVTGNPTTIRMEYRQGTTGGWQTAGFGTTVDLPLSNLSPNTLYQFRMFAQNSCNTSTGTPLSFTTPGTTTQCTPPSVSLNDATSIGPNSATISGTVTGNNTGVRFEYRRQGDSAWTSVQYGNGSANLTSLNSGTWYEYRIVADNTCGAPITSTRSFQTTTINTQCTPPFASTGSYTILSETSVRLTGSASNGSTVRIEYRRQGDLFWQTAGFGTTADVSGITPGVTYEYRIFAQNSCDTAFGSILTFRTTGIIQNAGQPPTVITVSATNRSASSALLNGTVNPNGGVTTSWFEWSSSAANVASGLGTRVPPSGQPAGSGYSALDYNAQIFGLTSGGTYFFRAVAENPNGRRYGEILRIGPIPTGGGGGGVVVTQPPVIVTTLAGGASGSCLTLTPSLNGQLLPGGEFVYGITYRNDCPFALQNTTLRNIIPNEVEFGNTNYPFLTRDLNVITYSLGTVPQNFQATILVRGIVKPTVRIGDTLIFRSELSFTDPQGRFQTISSTLPAAVGAATVDTTVNGQVLGASIFDTLGGLFTSGWFWFLLFLLLLALFILWLATRGRGEELEHE